MSEKCPQCGSELGAGAPGSPTVCPQCRPCPMPQATATASQRPTSVTVLGILCIVFGSLALLCMPASLGMTYKTQGMMGMSPGMKTWTVVSSLLEPLGK